jgi:hypothetical protein
VLTPSGKAARIVSIIKAGGYAYRFTAPSLGTLVVDWDATVKGKKVLVAARSGMIHSAGKQREKLKLTRKGRKLLKAARSVHIVDTARFRPTGTTATSASKGFTLKH